MDQLTGKDPTATSLPGFKPGFYLLKPSFHDNVYCISLELATTKLAQIPPKFQVFQPADKSTSYSHPSITDSDPMEQEVQLKRTSVILSHQDWFFRFVLHFSNHLVNQLDGSDTSKADLAHLQEFVYSALRAGSMLRGTCHIYGATSGRLPQQHPAQLQAPVKHQLQAHSLDSRLLF